MTDLNALTNQQLLEELAKRLGVEAQARPAPKKPRKEPTTRQEFLDLADWAERKVWELREQLAQSQRAYTPGARGLQKKETSQGNIADEIRISS